MTQKRIVHFINQFFAGIGAEKKAGIAPVEFKGAIGPGKAIQEKIGDRGKIVATIACGDNYFTENMEKASDEVINLISKYKPDIVIAGPAFRAGRYGTACGKVVIEAWKRLKVPAFTAMNEENPGVDLFRKDTYILKTGRSVAEMDKAVADMTRFLLKMIRGEKIGLPKEEGYFEKGIRVNVFAEEMGAKRAVDMLIAKLKGEKFETELPMPTFIKYKPQPAIEDPSKAKVGLVTSGGIVPKGNPDRLQASSATKYLEYSLEGVEELTPDKWQTAHGGYDPTFANEDPNRVLPLDVVRDLEREGKIGKLYEKYYVTVGNGTPIERAKRFGREIAKKLKEAGVDCAIVSSCCGTCTRCGATLSKTIEHEIKIPIAHITTLVPISKTIGANRIVPGVAIPHPLGDPRLPRDEEKKLRRGIVEEALRALTTEVEEQTVFKRVF
ncbi:MAG: glycine/betaine/sarcosine/D-proline family reductase selenoprotein B [Candidatus Bathyarchaeia archaeon]